MLYVLGIAMAISLIIKAFDLVLPLLLIAGIILYLKR